MLIGSVANQSITFSRTLNDSIYLFIYHKKTDKTDVCLRYVSKNRCALPKYSIFISLRFCHFPFTSFKNPSIFSYLSPPVAALVSVSPHETVDTCQFWRWDSGMGGVA